jgi:hypothetical protein
MFSAITDGGAAGAGAPLAGTQKALFWIGWIVRQ